MRKPFLAYSAVEHGIFLTAKYADYAEGRKAEREIRTSLCVIVRIPSIWRILRLNFGLLTANSAYSAVQTRFNENTVLARLFAPATHRRGGGLVAIRWVSPATIAR